VRKLLACLDAKILEVHTFHDLRCEQCHEHCEVGPLGRHCEHGGVLRNQNGKCVCDCSATDYTGAWCEIIATCTAGINGEPCQNNGKAVGDGENCRCECPIDERGAIYLGYNCQLHRSEVLYITPGSFSGHGKFFEFKDTEMDRLTGEKRWYKSEWNIMTEHNRQGKVKIYKNSRSCDECGRYRDTPTVNDFADESWIYLVSKVIKDDSVTMCNAKESAWELEADEEVGTAETSSNTTTYLMYAAACLFAVGAGYRYGMKASM